MNNISIVPCKNLNFSLLKSLQLVKHLLTKWFWLENAHLKIPLLHVSGATLSWNFLLYKITMSQVIIPVRNAISKGQKWSWNRLLAGFIAMWFSDCLHASLNRRAIFYSQATWNIILLVTTTGSSLWHLQAIFYQLMTTWGFFVTIVSNLWKCYSLLSQESSYLCDFFLGIKPIAVLQCSFRTLLEDAFVIS